MKRIKTPVKTARIRIERITLVRTSLLVFLAFAIFPPKSRAKRGNSL